MPLRPYQLEAVQSIYDALRTREDNPCCVIPTGGGKTHIMAQVCSDVVTHWDGRVLILAHVQELLEQTASTVDDMCPGVEVGVYSAGLGRRDTRQDIIVAGIQSVYQRVNDLFSPWDCVIVDEAHLLPPDGDGMYRTLMGDVHEANPGARVVGMTATPFRLKGGAICKPANILNHVCYEANVRDLIEAGYLCQLKVKAGVGAPDVSGLRVIGGEYVMADAEQLVDTQEYVTAACRDVARCAIGRRSVLVFAAGVAHGEHVVKELERITKSSAATIFGDTLQFERTAIIDDFKAGEIRFLVNVQVLTTGFNAPNVDCVVLLRPTASAGLYSQMVGRGLRVCADKTDCLILDYAGNVMRHGPIDKIQAVEPGDSTGVTPQKECPECHEIISSAYTQCPECGYLFPAVVNPKHGTEAGTEAVVSGQYEVVIYDDISVTYHEHRKRGAPDDAPRTLRVDYHYGFGIQDRVSEWLSVERTGWARQKAEQWWRKRCDIPLPQTAAAAMAMTGYLRETIMVKVKYTDGEVFPRIIGDVLGPAKEPPDFHDSLGIETPELAGEDEVPF